MALPGSAPGPLPAFFELTVPKTWTAIDFISDLHLCQAMPHTFAAFSHHLLTTSADAVYILGDLFEVWVGDDMARLPFEARCVEVLAQASSHRHIAFMVGNRDFLVGSALLREAGMMGLPDPTVMQAWGQRLLLSHGDALCLGDKPYQDFRLEVRSAAWQEQFLNRPLKERLTIAAAIRRASSGRNRFDGDASVDLDTGETVHWMHAMGTPEMVHGHTHRPGSSDLAPGYKRHVMSDWDLDLADRAEVLRLSRDGFERLPVARA